jgi:hypothetical protein
MREGSKSQPRGYEPQGSIALNITSKVINIKAVNHALCNYVIVFASCIPYSASNFALRNAPIQICHELSVKKFLFGAKRNRNFSERGSSLSPHFFVREFSFLQVSFAEKEMWKRNLLIHML